MIMLNVCPQLFGHVGKRLDTKCKAYFDVMSWERNK